MAYCITQSSRGSFIVVLNIYSLYTRLTNYGASHEAVNLSSRYVDKSTKCSESKCASYF
jgi:hypothetical protein